jgi:hypothetical protein
MVSLAPQARATVHAASVGKTPTTMAMFQQQGQPGSWMCSSKASSSSSMACR